MRTCSRCKRSKNIEDFSYNTITGYYQSWCKPCKSDYGTSKYYETRVESVRFAGDRIRHNYFSNIDTPEKAYILGFIAADGNVINSTVSIELSNKDLIHLKWIQEILIPGWHVLSTHNNCSKLNFNSKQMVKDLALCGIVPDKSFIVEWPNKLQPTLWNSYILGLFDGDGCLTSYWDKNPKHNIATSWDIVTGSYRLADAVVKNVFTSTGITLSKRDCGTTYRIKTKTQNWVKILDAWTHKDIQGLNRKKLDVVEAKYRASLFVLE